MGPSSPAQGGEGWSTETIGTCTCHFPNYDYGSLSDLLPESRSVVQPLGELGSVSVGPCSGKLGWAEPAVSTMGTVHVVVVSPVLNQHLGFEEGSNR
jgi:hypothetical protein